MTINILRIALTFVFCLNLTVLAQTQNSEQKQFREIYHELVEINTTDSAGDNTQAARAMAARLKAGGYTDADVQVIVPPGGPKKGNLVARLKCGGAKKPLLLLAHLDVVEAKREDWTTDPFRLVEKDGFYYGRGTSDDKFMAAAFVANLSTQLLTNYGAELADRLGLERLDARMLGTVGQTLAALAITIGALLVLYRLAPNGPTVRELLPGAIVGAVAVHLAILGFSVYLGLVAGFEEIYGALGGLFGFLFLVYLVSSAIVIGAEVVAAWPEAAKPPEPDGPPQSLRERVVGAVRGLVSAPQDPSGR